MTGEPITVERRPRTYLILVLVVLAVAGAAVGGYLWTQKAKTPGPSPAAMGDAPPKPPFILVADVNILTQSNAKVGLECFGDGTFRDLNSAPLTLTDTTGKVIKTGKLGKGSVIDHPDQAGYKMCSFAVRLEDVPAGVGIYGLQIASRDRIQLTEEQLTGSGHTVITLGV